MIKGREGNRGSSSSSGYSADLLVCFPSRAHLTLTPKPICSPSRPSDSTNNRRPHHRRQLSKLSAGSPVLWAKQASVKNLGGDEIAEPTSPKVTCAGQIKVRPSKCGGKGKNWQSVMEEIERIHVKNRTQSKFFGLKKDVMGFLTCMRNIRFDFRCFGDFRHADVTSDEEEDDDDDDDDEEVEEEEEEEENSKTLFSKWFMVLQEEQSNNDKDKNSEKCVVVDDKHDSDAETAVPPPNALLLMRCRSAPAKSWLKERMKAKAEQVVDNRGETEEEETEEDQESSTKNKKKKNDLRSLMEEEEMELVLMRYDTEYYRLSSDIAKETWVVGGIQDSLSRSRSWKS